MADTRWEALQTRTRLHLQERLAESAAQGEDVCEGGALIASQE